MGCRTYIWGNHCRLCRRGSARVSCRADPAEAQGRGRRRMNVGTPGFNGERLIEARMARGLTAVALSEMVGVSSQSISQYEKGKQSPRPEVLGIIASRLNMP